jgi:paxillin
MDGEVYCENDYHKLFSPRCDFCAEPIRHNGILALGKRFHRDCCLRCAACSKILKEDNYISVNDKAYCKSDWKKLFAPRCETCKRPVSQALTGDSVIALGKEYHPECFFCKECQLILDPRSYYEVDNQPYCYEHYHNKTCTDCLKSKSERAAQHKKILPKANSTITRRSLTPIDFFRPKSSNSY